MPQLIAGWWLKPLVFVLACVPMLQLAGWIVADALGANPVEAITDWSGQWAIRLLLITLTMTPLRSLSGWQWPVRVRRMLGLFAFFYGCLHFLTFIGLDHAFVWSDIAREIVKRPYVAAGFMAWTVMLALAVTSNSWSIKRLKSRWSALHRQVYLALVAVLLHYVWLVKSDYALPALYLALTLLLFGYRMAGLIRRGN